MYRIPLNDEWSVRPKRRILAELAGGAVIINAEGCDPNRVGVEARVDRRGP